MTTVHPAFRVRLARTLIVALLSVTQMAQARDAKSTKATALYAPPPQLPEVAMIRRYAGSGLFLSRVRPDGTVSRVEVLRSTGHRELDDCVIAAFSKWRFRPGTMSEVRTPVNFTGNYTRRR